MSAMPVTQSKDTSASVTGVVQRVLFHSPDTGHSILIVNREESDQTVTVVGPGAVKEGDWVRATGHWATHPKYGLQVKADSIEATLPSSHSSIERYLASGILPGVGPSLAERIMAKFGDDALKILDREPGRIIEVQGIGARKAERIKEAWDAQRAYSRAALFLTSLGATQGLAARVWAVYGIKTVDTVTRNPYRMIDDIRGVGFPTADTMALALGVARDSQTRIAAGINHAVDEAVHWGSCGVPVDTVVRSAAKVLGQPAPAVRAALDLLTNLPDTKLVEGLAGDQHCVFPKRLWDAEQFIATELTALLRQPPLWPGASRDDVAALLREDSSTTLTTEQLDGVWRVFTSRISILTGGPGTGKTATLEAALGAFHARDLRVKLAAPTGKAAKRMQEVTGYPASTVARLVGTKGDAIECDVLVLDEVSMVDVGMLRAVLRQTDGKVTILLVGDVDQLPSISPGRVLSDLVASGAVPVTSLTHVFRQAAQSAIVRNAHRINHGWPLEAAVPDGAPQSDFYFIRAKEPAEIAATVLDLVTKRVPKWLGISPQDVQVLSPMRRTETGVNDLNAALQSAINPEPEAFTLSNGARLGVGDRIIHIVNDYDLGVMNGETGTIRHVDTKTSSLFADMGERPVVYPFADLDEVELAYAMTIHKSQGSQYPAVVIPVTHQHHLMLQRSLLYTAVTRATRLCVLVGDPEALEYAVRNVREDKRITRLKELLQGGGEPVSALPLPVFQPQPLPVLAAIGEPLPGWLQ